MAGKLTLHLAPFGAHALDVYVAKCSGSASDAVRLAASYYLADADGDRVVWRVPSNIPSPGEDSRDLELEVDDHTWHALNDEARRQNIDVARLAAHAVLYFLADWDSGRLAARLREPLTESLFDRSS